MIGLRYGVREVRHGPGSLEPRGRMRFSSAHSATLVARGGSSIAAPPRRIRESFELSGRRGPNAPRLIENYLLANGRIRVGRNIRGDTAAESIELAGDQCHGPVECGPRLVCGNQIAPAGRRPLFDLATLRSGQAKFLRCHLARSFAALLVVSNQSRHRRFQRIESALRLGHEAAPYEPIEVSDRHAG